MDVLVTQDQEVFKPVNIIIKINNENELEALKALISNNSPLSLADTPYGAIQCKSVKYYVAFASEFLNKIHKSLKEMK